MKTFYLIWIFCLPAISAHAQSNDSLVVLFLQVEPGVRLGFEDVDYGGKRLDADGDGIAEFLELETNDNGFPIKINVRSILLDSLLYVVDLQTIRMDLQSKGFTIPDVANLRFERFLQWLPENDTAPIGAMLFSANDGVAIHDPSTGFNIGMPPSVWKLFAVVDFEDDGWSEIIVGNKQLKVVEVYGSRFAPGN